MLRSESGKNFTGNERFVGYSVDLAQKISEIIKFEYEFRVVKDGKFGVKGEFAQVFQVVFFLNSCKWCRRVRSLEWHDWRADSWGGGHVHCTANNIIDTWTRRRIFKAFYEHRNQYHDKEAEGRGLRLKNSFLKLIDDCGYFILETWRI
jgi:hypothetical protein